MKQIQNTLKQKKLLSAEYTLCQDIDQHQNKNSVHWKYIILFQLLQVHNKSVLLIGRFCKGRDFKTQIIDV